MEERTTNEAFYIVVDIAFFVIALVAYYYIMTNCVSISRNEIEKAGSNTTITSQYISEDTNKGYSDGNNIIYDGTITGSAVIADILSAEDERIIYIGGSNLNIMTHDGMDFLTYCRYYDAKPLTEIVYDSLKYQRQYEIAADGTISAVKYIIQ